MFFQEFLLKHHMPCTTTVQKMPVPMMIDTMLKILPAEFRCRCRLERNYYFVDDSGGKSPTENNMNASFSVAGGIATKRVPVIEKVCSGNSCSCPSNQSIPFLEK